MFTLTVWYPEYSLKLPDVQLQAWVTMHEIYTVWHFCSFFADDVLHRWIPPCNQEDTTVRTAYEDGQWRSGQWNDEWRASEQRIDHSSDALANNGLLNICQNNRTSLRFYASDLTADSIIGCWGVRTDLSSRAFVIQWAERDRRQ